MPKRDLDAELNMVYLNCASSVQLAKYVVARMDNTEVGSSGKTESQPAKVARQGIGALLSGKDHVYAASAKTKMEG